MEKFVIRDTRADEIETVAGFIAEGYLDDIYFHWVVDVPEDRFNVIKAYYVIYLSARGAVSHVCEDEAGRMVGATCWLPHDLDEGVDAKVYAAAGKHAHTFKQVSKLAAASCPPIDEPYFELVSVVTAKDMQGKGIGAALLKHHIDILDPQGIHTYLEASTPYHGGGVYGKFGYQQAGELMVFAPTAILYPLWREARKAQIVKFGNFQWRVLKRQKHATLLIMEDVLDYYVYYPVFKDMTWAESLVRYMLWVFYKFDFTEDEKARIGNNHSTKSDNPWYGTKGGKSTIDKIFLLSVEEIVKYFGDSGQLKAPNNRFFIDDIYNDARKPKTPARWLTRTPGNAQNMVAVVTEEGKILITGDFVTRETNDLFKVGVRPAMWVTGEI